jgi:hypothetical protein
VILYNNPPVYDGGVTPAPEEGKFQISPPSMALSLSLSLAVASEALVAVLRLRVRGG